VTDLLADTSILSTSDAVSTARNGADLNKIVARLEAMILRHSAIMRAKVVAYFDSVGLKPDAARNIGVFDIGYSGSLQRYINKIFGASFTEGFYFATFVGVKALLEQGGRAHGYAGENVDPRITKHQYVHAVHIFETIFSHTDGSTFNYMRSDGKVDPIKTAEQSFAAKNHFVTQLWRGIDLFNETRAKYAGLIDWTQFNWEKALKPFDDFVNNPLIDDIYMLDDVKFENLYCGEPPAPIVSYRGGGRALWGHGQQKVNQFIAGKNQAALRHTMLAKQYETLEDYLSMLYEEEFIKFMQHEHAKKTRDYETIIGALEVENEELKTLVAEHKSHPADVDYLAKISLPMDNLLDGIDNWFSEPDYLRANPDVDTAIKKGEIQSGLQHFKQFGFKEGRKLVV
jgi:hypothetical protein